MKRLLFGFLCTIIVISGSFVAARHFWRGKTLSAVEAKQRWGAGAFDAKRFKEGTPEARAKMAFSILKHPDLFKGKDPLEMREMLGDPDGFYFVDIFPAYIIHVGRDRQEDTWQLVFLLDRKKRVSEIIVHRNCCER